MLFIQIITIFAAFVAIAAAVPASDSFRGSPTDALSAIHAVIHHHRSGSLNFSRSARATTPQSLTRFLAAARSFKSESVDEAAVILPRGKNAALPPSTMISFAETFIAKVKRVQSELAGAYSTKVSRAATREDEAKLRSPSTEAREGRRDGGGLRARRASELALLVTSMKPDRAAREEVGGFEDRENHSGRVSGAGLTLDPCVSSLDCVGLRECNFFGHDFETCSGRTGCMCSPVPPQACVSSPECVDGEFCESVGELSLCISDATTVALEAPEIVEGLTGPGREPPDNSVPTVRDGLSFDVCFADSDCKSPRSCLSTASLVPCDGTTDCLCGEVPPDECNSSSSCFSGEVCVLIPDDIGPWCVSPAAAEIFVELGGTIITDGSESTGSSEEGLDDKPPATDAEDQPPTTESESESVEESDEDGGQDQVPFPFGDVDLNTEFEDDSADEGACVDAKALAHMPTSDLVFKRHPRARVLCDAQSSCATPGHIVVFRGEAMMMKSYCKLTTCSERVMEVNSPRYRRQLLVSSNTDELKFTVFASRYETRGEETLMSMAVRMGL